MVVRYLSLLPLLILSAITSACSIPSPEGHVRRHSLIRINEDDAKGLDPQSNSDLASTRIASELFEGLTRFDADGKPEPGLALKWQSSADGLRWSFVLRQGLRFSDGKAITGRTFEQVFVRLRKPETATPHLALFEPIASLREVEPNKVEIRLTHPFPALPELLAHPALAALPVHRGNWMDDRPLIVSGAYQLREWTLNDHLKLVANPAWHGGKPAIAEVEWKPISDSLVALRLFLAGGADTLGELPSTRLQQLRLKSGDQLHLAPYSGSYYFAFNTRKLPFSDQRVRLALSMAVEREWLTKKLLATGVQPAWGIIPSGTTGLEPYKPNWAAWPRAKRLAFASELLRQAGYGKEKPLDFEIRFNSDVDHRRVSVALAAMWKPLGVEARLLNSEASLHFASLRRGDFALARSGWIGDLPVPENYLAVHTEKGGPVNYSGFHDYVYEATLAKASLLAEPKERAKAMRNAEAQLIGQMPILPLYHYVSKSMVAPRVSGWHDNAANVHPSRTLSFQ